MAARFQKLINDVQKISKKPLFYINISIFSGFNKRIIKIACAKNLKTAGDSALKSEKVR